MANDDKDATKAEVCLAELPTDAADPATEVAMTVALEKEAAAADAAGAGQGGAHPSGGSDAVSVLSGGPRAVAGRLWVAAWPLVLMWPFLFATYQASVALGVE